MSAETYSRKKKSTFSGENLIENTRLFLLMATPIIVFLILWQFGPELGLFNPVIIPTQSKIVEKGIDLILSGELVTNILVSVGRIAIGFGIALGVALPLGFLLGGWFRTFETSVNPLLQVVSQANPFTLFPVFITLLGIGELSKISIIFWVCQWPVLFNTVLGIKNADPTLVKMARSVGIKKWHMFTKILLPGALPSVFNGIRMSALFAFFMLIGAEMIGAHSGIGYMILQAQATFQMPQMWVGIVTVAFLGILINWIIIQIEKRLSGWREECVLQ